MSELRYRLARPNLGETELEAVHRVFDSGNLVQGREVVQFEEVVRELVGVQQAIAVSSGTAAIHVAYLAMNIQPGDIVYIPSFAWPSAANLAVLIGALPILIDVLPGTYNIDVAHLRVRIEKSIREDLGTPRLIVAIHQFGLPCDLDAVLEVAEEYELDVLEDAACALGAIKAGGSSHVGSLGKAGVFSFHPLKSITTGEGGMVVTNDEELAVRCRAFRNHGRAPGSVVEFPGLNYRMTEFQAAIGTTQLAGGSASKLARSLKRRREIVLQYIERLSGCKDIDLPEAPEEHTWQTFMVVLKKEDRNEIIRMLRDNHGVEAGIGSVDAHSMEVFKAQPGWQSLPESERLARQGLSLPLYPELSVEDVNYCVKVLLETLRAIDKSGQMQ